jgi:hypothetical protein
MGKSLAYFPFTRRKQTTALKSHSSTPDSCHSGEDPRWPVLARLEDVSDQLAASSPRSKQAAAAGFVTYRFDPPQRAAAESRGSAKAPADIHAASHTLSRSMPHMANRARGPRRRPSQILPKNNPFEFPRLSLQEKIAPAIQFLVLFALFTAVGTTLLSIDWHGEQASEAIAPAAVNAPHSVAPRTATAPSDAVDTHSKGPTAAGPLGGTTPKPKLRARANISTTNEAPHRVASHAPAASPVVPQTELPKVRTSESTGVSTTSQAAPPPESIARLPGYILEAPPQQANHDQNKSGLY